MTKKYQLSITAGYCHDWSVENAVRELFQNQLDSPAEGDQSYDDGVLTVISYGTKIPTKTLLMGCTTKRGDGDSVGGKGEGYKLACGILLREGLGIEIYNGDVKWTPVFEYHPDFDEEVLFIYEEPLEGNNDLSFVVSGLDEETFDTIKKENLYLRDDITDVLHGSRGSVIKDFGGKIYVGGLYVCDDSRLKYSYDFKPEYLPLNRDRKSVCDWDLRQQTSKLLTSLFDMSEVVEDIKGGVWELDVPEYWHTDEVKEACFNEFKKEYEGNCIANTESDKKKLSSQYNVRPVILDSQLFSSMVFNSSGYRGYLEENEKPDYVEDERTPLDILKLLGECDLSQEALDKFNQIVEIFEDRGVYWDDETIDIPF